MKVFLVDYLHRVRDARELAERFQPAQKAGRGHTGSISNAPGGGETEAQQGVGRHGASQPPPQHAGSRCEEGLAPGDPCAGDTKQSWG